MLAEELAPALETIGIEGSGSDRRLDGAARLMGMGAIAEFAERREFGDFGEERVEAGRDGRRSAASACPACR